MDVKVHWDCAMLFRGFTPEATTIMMDAHPEHGGTNAGPTPMDTLLIALAGWTGMDVIAILKKMRAPVERFAIDVHAERAADHPRVLTAVHLRALEQDHPEPLDDRPITHARSGRYKPTRERSTEIHRIACRVGGCRGHTFSLLVAERGR